MTNEDILNIVYSTYKVSTMIKKLIRNSPLDQSYKDLEQIIYIQLFTMDNEKLKSMFERNELKRWINQIIKNQRNDPRSHYNKCLMKDCPEIVDRVDESIYNPILDWLDNELNKFDWDGDMTREDIAMAGNYEILKFYLSSGYSMSRIGKLFGVSNTKINKMIIAAKNNIKLEYDNNFDDYTEQFMGTTFTRDTNVS